MSKVTFKGIAPAAFYKQSLLDCLNRVNEETVDFEREIVDATPVGVGGSLRLSWNVQLGTESNPVIKIGQTKKYFIPLEVGRKPGKGVSKQGQISIARWAKRKLGLNNKEAQKVAILTSLKYYKEGRPATGFFGLAKEGAKAPARLPDNIKPVSGSLLDAYFRRIAFRFK